MAAHPTKSRPDPALTDWLLSLTTLPLLAGVVVGKTLVVAAQELGQLSEEVLRGDRLPLLQFPAAARERSEPNEPGSPESVRR